MLESWITKPPPKNTLVMASYGVLEEVKPLKTCKYGCCVSSPFLGECMTLPLYWRMPTAAEIAAVEKEVSQIKTSPRELAEPSWYD